MSSPKRATDTPIAIDVEAGKSYFWCACGLSQKQPFCDGSHNNSDNSGNFLPIKYQASESKRVFFCGCKQSQKSPLCDGSHNKN